ncbi:TonB-dependent siderophore receptor [Luteimonas salinilitoris]|uniref:TonB-dependent siderophore receptor n=1 Tax=Luteimonas salinilitoris TaxID=3237697 RepID=A0ABV4HTC1_9GAMM
MRDYVPRRRLLAVSLSLAATMPAAWAQDAATLDTVTVVAERATTATKTETALTETPQAISVVSSDLFRERGALNLQDTLRYSAGVTAEAFGLDTRADVSTVRGLDPVQYLDGMRQLFNYSPIARPEVYTLDRVEVLRGPSSVLYGAGGNGGIINAISKRPQFLPAGELALQYGSFDRKQVQLDVTGPLNDDDTLAGRVVAVARDSGMQTDRLPDDRLLLSPSLTWRPGDRTEVTLIGLFQRDETGSSQQFLPVVSTLQASGPRRLDVSTFLGDEDYDRLDARQNAATLLVEHRLNDTTTLRSSSRYVDARTTFQQIFPDVYATPSNPFNADGLVERDAYAIKPHIRIFTTDNNAEYAFDTGAFSHRLLVGLDYSEFRQSSHSAFGRITPIDIYDPVSTGVVAPEYVRDPDQRNTQVGLYLQDQIRYADRVSLVLGLRRDRARSTTEGSDTQTDEATTFKVGVIGEVAAGWSPYVSYSESFLPVAGLDFYGDAFKPVRGSQYEAGVKWAPNRTALVTANVYRIEETNRATNDPENVLNTVQTGEIRSQGFELEGAFVIAGDIALNTNYSYNDAEVTRSNFAPEVGQRLSDMPRHLASAWAAKTFAVSDDAQLRVGLGGRYVGATMSTAGDGVLRTPGYTLADALVAYELRDWSLSLNATNLFDRQYYAPCRAFGDCFTGTGRSLVGTVAYRF